MVQFVYRRAGSTFAMRRPFMPNFAIPEEFGTEEGYRKKYTDEDLFEEFTRDENGNVVLSREDFRTESEETGWL